MKMWHLLIWIMAACLVVSAQVGTASDPSPLPKEAENLVFQFEVMVAEKSKPLSKLEGQYQSRLVALKEEAQRKGKLKEVLRLKETVELLQRGETVEPREDDPAELVKAREIYENAKLRIGEEVAREIRPLRNKLVKHLLDVKAGYTREGKIDEAIAVKAFLESEKFKETAAVVPPSSPEPEKPTKRSLEVRVQVDGRTALCMRGSEVWLDHTRGNWKAAGLQGGPHPTHLDGEEWFPEWEGKITQRHDAGIALPLDEPSKIRARVSDGRGMVVILEQPNEKNDYTARIDLRDETETRNFFGGADWLEFRLSW